MWRPYLEVIAKRCPQALNILDRFHMVAKLNKALDELIVFNHAGEAGSRSQNSPTDSSDEANFLSFSFKPAERKAQWRAQLDAVFAAVG
jgi:hypothetical protein